MKKVSMFVRLLCVAALTPLSSGRYGRAVEPATVHVEVAGLRSDHGRVWCFLYNSASGFPKDQNASFKRTSNEIRGNSSSCEFSGVTDGTYAISVYHDENGNGRLDSNFLGISKEGVGASNDAKGHLGPPKFKDAMFQMEGTSRSLTIHVNYL